MTTTPELLAVLFPGQGSQEIGMGRDLAEADRDVMELWKQAEKLSGGELRAIYWDGDEAAMSQTRWLQPALTVVGISLWNAARDRLRPAMAAGHSLGEYAALFAAGVLTAPDALRLVCLRGQLMADAGDADPKNPGAMAAVVKLPQDQVEAIVLGVVAETGLELRLANYNSPAQFVLSGHRQAVELAGEKVRDARGRAVPLAVSGAFHSPLMAPAAKVMAKAIDEVKFHTPRFPVVANATGHASGDPLSLAGQLKAQMTASVLWIQTLATMWDHGVRYFVELGPKGVLTKLLKANLEHRSEPWQAANYSTLGHLESL